MIATYQNWYLAFRKQGHKPQTAMLCARYSHEAEINAMRTLASLTHASRKRVQRFADDFIRGEFVYGLTAERDNDFFNEPERAERCYQAAEHGCDGKTHSEVIQDWRDAFSLWQCDRRQLSERFTGAVLALWMLTELWHSAHGSLHQEIG